MHYLKITASALLLVMLLPLSLYASADIQKGGFISWASEESSALDARWSVISARGGSAIPLTGAVSSSPRFPSPRAVKGKSGSGKLRTSIVVSRNFINEGRNIPFLPLSTKKRSSPSRGTGILRNPSNARLHVAYKRLRPVKSFVTEKRFFGARKSIRRPRLRYNRRISLSRYRSGRNATRPAYRAARPKRFKSIF